MLNPKYYAAGLPSAPADGQDLQLQVDINGNLKTVSAATDPGNVSLAAIAAGFLTASQWAYAAPAAGISNSAVAVTIKAAAGAGLRNYISAIQITAEALGAATEFAVRDGAAGAVLWRCKIGTAGIVNGISINFPVPLKGTANTLLEVITLTASITGAVYVNAQGFQAA